MDEQGMRPPRFRVLRSLTNIYVAFGWIGAAVGLAMVLWGVANVANATGRHQAGTIMYILQGVGGLVGGLLTVGFGQLVQCFIAIEENTRKPAEDRQAGT